MLYVQKVELEGFELDELVEVQVMYRPDWAAQFSCNRRAQVWPAISYGYSDTAQRFFLEGAFPILDRLVRLTLFRRWLGGRIFLCEHGAWTFDEDAGLKIELAEFLLRSQTVITPACATHRPGAGLG